GSLHVTAVLADGTPIKDAVLCLYPKRYVRWDEPELARRTNQGPGWAWSDDGGTICMREAPAGGYPVLLDAPGMQPREFIVSVQPGQQVDLGRVVLEPADGEVRVQVIGADEEVCYYVCLLPPGHNPSHEQSWRSGDPDTVFKPVPRREYWICLQRQDDKSGEVVSVIVDFSDGVARQVVTLDARRIGQE
ncbi:MAG: hypothetical protein IT463_14875, partial [Planctomycetes bacterium]|nr:hypothetical protein [Planctomycetota bacterium]